MFITLKRIISAGLKTFWRNGFLSSSSILTLTITLVIAGIFYFSILLGQFSLKKVEDKVDINVYFTPDAPMEKVAEFKNEIFELPEIDKTKTKLLTKEEALEDFKKDEKNKKIIEEVLGVIEKNPMGPVLNIKGKNLESYKMILSFLKSDEVQAKYLSIIDNTNYNENDFTINRIKIWLKYAKIISLIILGIFAFISLIIIHNTIRLIIYSYKEEIQVMRLIGASNFFARGPFLIEGMLYGFISGIFALFIIWAMVYFSPDLIKQISSLNLNTYFSDNIFKIGSVFILAGMVISFISTYFAVAKYLKVEEEV